MRLHYILFGITRIKRRIDLSALGALTDNVLGCKDATIMPVGSDPGIDNALGARASVLARAI